MFEILREIERLRAEIEHISQITGLSIGVLIVLALVIWFDPGLRKAAIRGVIAVATAYLIAIYCYALGAHDVRGQWNAANVAAAAAAKARDAAIEKALEEKYGPQQAADQKASDDEQDKILAAISAAAGATCQLGADALRLRNGR